MLSKYYEDNQGPVCKIGDCKGCTRDCKMVYQQTCIDYEQEGLLTEQEQEHLRAITRTESLNRQHNKMNLHKRAKSQTKYRIC